MKGFDFVGFISYFGNGFLWRGALTTLWLTAIPIAAGLVLGTFVALMNMSKNRALQGFAQFYIWIFRGTPLLIQLVIIYTGLPQFGIRLGVVESALIALTLNETAYLLGYEDSSSFVRAFRGWEGVPPAHWRDVQRAKAS